MTVNVASNYPRNRRFGPCNALSRQDQRFRHRQFWHWHALRCPCVRRCSPCRRAGCIRQSSPSQDSRKTGILSAKLSPTRSPRRGTSRWPRIKLYQKFIEQRIAAIKELGTNPKAEDRKAELRARFEEFTRLSDELQDNLDTFDDAHADIRKALKELVPASAKWPDILKQAAADPTYDFSRKTALDAAESTSDVAKKLLDSQVKYFAEHKDEANKNGTGPG